MDTKVLACQRAIIAKIRIKTIHMILAYGGMLKDLEQKVDENGIYKKGFLLHRYRITDFGITRATDACLRGL